MDKEDMTYLDCEILLRHKKEWNFAIFNNMDRFRECYTKYNKSDRERQTPYDFTHVWGLKKKKWTIKTEIDSELQKTNVARGEEVGR